MLTPVADQELDHLGLREFRVRGVAQNINPLSEEVSGMFAEREVLLDTDSWSLRPRVHETLERVHPLEPSFFLFVHNHP